SAFSAPLDGRRLASLRGLVQVSLKEKRREGSAMAHQQVGEGSEGNSGEADSRPQVRQAGSSVVARRASESQPRQLSPLLVWAVVFCDIGTSVYYVPGILYSQAGAFTPLFIIATIIGFIPLAAKYQEICWR